MSHFVTSLTINNYKSCKDLTVSLASFVSLVGYNNAGKSNILSALEWLFKERMLALTEFCDKSKPVIVEGEVTGITDAVIDRLDEEHRDAMRPYVLNGTVKLRRTQPPTATKKSDVILEVFHPVTGFKKNPRGIWNAIKLLFPEPIRVAAMENAADDSAKAKSTNTIGKLLAEFFFDVQKEHSPHMDRYFNAISRRLSADGARRLSGLGDIDDSINGKLAELFPGMSLKLHFEVPSFLDLFKAGTVRVYEGGDEGRDFIAYGHGAQRSIQMALIRHLAEVKKNNDSPSTTLLLIDEPELYLHPFAIEQVREALLALSENGYQIIFTTHSAQMVTAELAQYSLLIRKSDQVGTVSRKRLKDALNVILPNALSQAEHLFSLSQSTAVLFADRVILTEGKTELRLLPHIYKAIGGKTLGQNKLALIETGSVDAIAKTLDVLREMDLPAKAVVDLDYAFRGAIQNKFVDGNDPDLLALKSILQRLASNGQCSLDGNGVPTKNGVVTAAKAYELMASEADAEPYLESLHQKLMGRGIWLWKKGAIEAHLGIAAKNETAWAMLKGAIDLDGLDASCPDSHSIRQLAAWISI